MILDTGAGRGGRRPARVLIVDDVAQVSAVMARLLLEEGAVPEVVSTGKAALAASALDPAPDMVLLDLHLPDMTGLEVCRRMRSDARLRGVPILMVTGHAESEFEGLDAGADDYLTKPFDLRKLRARIAARLRRSNETADLHPMTRLPGSPAIRREVERRLADGMEFCVTYADLEGFKHFNDTAGYHIGDALIQELAAVLSAAVSPERGDFLGHIGGDDFILITRTVPDRGRLELEFGRAAAQRLSGHGLNTAAARLYAGLVVCSPGVFRCFDEVAAAASRAKKAVRAGRDGS